MSSVSSPSSGRAGGLASPFEIFAYETTGWCQGGVKMEAGQVKRRSRRHVISRPSPPRHGADWSTLEPAGLCAWAALVRRELEEGAVKTTRQAMRVRDRMTRAVATTHPEVPVTAAAELMRKRALRHLPVVDPRGRLVGIITDRDLRQVVFMPALRNRVREIGELLQALTVSDIMTRDGRSREARGKDQRSCPPDARAQDWRPPRGRARARGRHHHGDGHPGGLRATLRQEGRRGPCATATGSHPRPSLRTSARRTRSL